MDDKLLQEIDGYTAPGAVVDINIETVEKLLDLLQQARDRLGKKKDTVTMPRSIYKMLTERAELHPDSAKLLYENAEDLYITSPPPGS
jgi:CHAD domain-containing protein